MNTGLSKDSSAIDVNEIRDKLPWPDPTPEMLEQQDFNRVWELVKTWDINVPEQYCGYCGATGNHVRAILDAIKVPSKKEMLARETLLSMAIDKWNKDAEDIAHKADALQLVDQYGWFKWEQLVWQEIHWWCISGKLVDRKEMEFLSDRRGFDFNQRQYLVDMLKYIGLWKGE